MQAPAPSWALPMEGVNAGGGITLAGEHLLTHVRRGDTRRAHQVFLFLGWLALPLYCPRPVMLRGAHSSPRGRIPPQCSQLGGGPGRCSASVLGCLGAAWEQRQKT